MYMFCFLSTFFPSHDFGCTKEKNSGRTPKYGHTTRLPGGGEGDTPLYKLYRYVLPYRVAFLGRFGLKMNIRFANFGVESGMVFEGTTECMNVF